jgi:hypothetical protein
MKRSATPAWSFLVLLLCLLPASKAHALSLTMAASETTVVVGNPVFLRVLIDATPDLKAAELIYGYTPGRLTFTSASNGGALNNGGGSVADFILPDVTAPADSVWYDAARLNGSGSGPGVVVFLRFDTHTVGDATVNCLFNDLRNSLNNLMPASCAGALIHVIAPVPTLTTTWGRLKTRYR